MRKVTPEYNLYVDLPQPLRVESGSTEVVHSSARTPDRKLLTECFRAALYPDGRQIDFQEGVILLLSKNAKLGAQAWTWHISRSSLNFGTAIAYQSDLDKPKFRPLEINVEQY